MRVSELRLQLCYPKSESLVLCPLFLFSIFLLFLLLLSGA